MKKNYSIILVLFTLLIQNLSGQIVMTEIMYNPPESGTDSLEFIELYNAGNNTVNISGYSFTNGISITLSTIIDSGNFVIVCEDSIALANTFGINGYEWVGSLSNGGEPIVLRDSQGLLVDSVEYSSSGSWPSSANGNGYSLVLCDPKSDNSLAENWSAASTNTGITINGVEIFAHPDTLCPKCQVIINDTVTILAGDSIFVQGAYQTIEGVYYDTLQFVGSCDSIIITTLENFVAPAELVITEIMYNPPESGTDSLEFIELFNAGKYSGSVKGFQFTSGVSMTFPDMVLAVGEYIVVCEDSIAMLNVFGINGYEWASGSLTNGGEAIVVKDVKGNIVDSVNYDNVSPWPTKADGDGYSMVLCDLTLDNNDGTNWEISQSPVNVSINGTDLFADPGEGCSIVCPQIIYTEETTICTGDSIFLEGDFQHIPGVYIDTIVLANTCDSIIEVTLSVNDSIKLTINDTICQGDSLLVGGVYQTTSGSYVDIYTSGIGCDSVVTTELVVSNIFVDCISTGIITENRTVTDLVTIYPNPNNGLVNLINKTTNEIVGLEVFDTQGRLVTESVTTSTKTILNLQHLEVGMYYVVADDQFVQKMIIQ